MDIGRVQPTGTGFGDTAINSAIAQPGTSETAATQRDLIKAVKAVNGAELFGQDSELTFVLDRETHKALVRVINKKTREVMMQIPPESVLKMAAERMGT